MYYDRENIISKEQYKIALKNGIKKSTAYRRVVEYGWDIESAITTPVISREYRSRKHPKEYTDLALQNGVCMVTFYNRLKKGWSYEMASTIKPIQNKDKRTFKYDNIKR